MTKTSKKKADAKTATKKAAVKKRRLSRPRNPLPRSCREPHLAREHLPIPDAKHVGLTTYDAKDPNTKYPPIKELRPPAGAPNVLIVLIDDVGFGASSAFGGPCQHAGRRAAGRRRPEAQPLPHHRAVLADAPGAADRPQPPLGRHGRDHRDGDVGAGQQQHPAQGEGADRRNPEAQRLFDRAVRQVPRGAGVGGLPGRARSISGRPGSGFEYFYGFVGGEANQYYPGLYEGTTAVEPPKIARGGLHADRGSRRPRDHLGAAAEGADAGQAVLHVLRARRHARAAPRVRRNGRTSTRASSTTAGTCCGRRRSRGRRSSA